MESQCVPALPERTQYATREEWLADRRSYIGASEIAALFGAGYRGQSPATVYAEKVSDRPPDRKASMKMDLGSNSEEGIIKTANKHLGVTIIPSELCVVRFSALPFLAATPDGWTEHQGQGWYVPVEVKNLGIANSRELREEGTIPFQYMLQVQHQILCCGTVGGYFLANVANDDLFWQFVPRDEEMIKLIIQQGSTFWSYVERRTMPPDADCEAVRDALNAVYYRDRGTALDLSDDPKLVELVDLRDECSEMLKTLSERKTAAENSLKAKVGEHSYGLLADGRVLSWKTIERREYTVAATSYRQFRILKSLPKGALIQ